MNAYEMLTVKDGKFVIYKDLATKTPGREENK
jgi:hypothetical protein